GSAMAVVEATHVGASDALHHARHTLGGGRREQQMEVVVHQHPRVHRHLVGAGVLEHQCHEQLTIGVVDHDGLPVVATLDDVVRVAGDGEAGQACHGRSGDVAGL